MKTTLLIGVVLVLLGVAGLVYGGVRWTHHDRVVAVGPIELMAEHRRTFPVAPLVAILTLVAGGAFIFAGLRKA